MREKAPTGIPWESKVTKYNLGFDDEKEWLVTD